MTTPNVVPIIPSAALGTESLLPAHVTLTPLGAPGLNASVPGAHPDARVEETRCGNMTKDSEETLLESAKAYFPAQADVTRALSNFKAYLPEGFVAYLPGSTVDLGHATSVPSPEPSASADVPIPAGDESTTVHTGYSTDAIPPSTSGPHLPLVPSPSAPTPKASTTAERVQSHPTWTLSLDSGYAGSSESELAQTPAPMDSSAHTPISSNPNDIFLSSSPLVPALDVLGSAALNSTKPKELTPPDDSPVDSARAADVSLPSDAHLLGSAALNSSNPKDFLPSGGVEASASDVIAPAVDENAALDASVDAPVISGTAVEVQGRRAIFSDARLGALGEGEDAPVLGLHSVAPEHVHSASAPASAAAPEMDAMNAPAPEGGEAHIFTAYGLHVPTPGARIQGEPQAVGAADGHEDGSGAAHKPGTHELDTHGEHRDGSGDAQGKGKGRRSRLVANLKEKMHVG